MVKHYTRSDGYTLCRLELGRNFFTGERVQVAFHPRDVTCTACKKKIRGDWT